VTAAFAETTTVLYSRQKFAASVAELERTTGQYREMVRLSTLRYNSGLSNYFEVLYAMQLLYPAEFALVVSRVRLLNDYVDIYKALGGGWNIQTPDWTMPSAQPVSSTP
jgi:multidrug efflux system outer membrane protein